MAPADDDRRAPVGGAADARPGPLILAHRGDHRSAPENSLAAFAAATALPGCDGVELDVRAAGDGVAVVSHDPTLLRVHGVRARIDRLTSNELAAIGVPTLAAALAAVPPPAFVDIELKDDVVGAALPVIVAAREDPPTAVVLSSFDPGILARLKALAPAWPLWLNADRLDRATVREAVVLGCSGVSIRWTAIDAASIRIAQETGLDVAAWTVRRPSVAQRLAALGVTAVCAEGSVLGTAPADGPSA